MGLIKVLSDALHRQLVEGVQANVIPRGISIPLDPFALGEVRFGRKLEPVLPMLVPDNRFKLAEDAVFQMDRITLDREPSWMEPGGYVFIGQRELHEIEDISGTTVILATRILADHLAGQFCYHYSNPIKVEGNYVEGNDVINIDVPYFIVRGDVLAISVSTATPVLAFREYTIEDFSLTSVIGGIRQYHVTLDRGVHRELEDEEIIQLRAYLGYKSRILTLPIQAGAMRRLVGPFLLDWLSAPFINNLELYETQTIQRYDIAHNPVGPPEIIEKNHYILDLPIEAEQFLFWDKVQGSMNYDKSIDKYLINLDANGRWWLKHYCAPKMTVPFTYASGSIVTPDKSALSNNEWFRIYDGIDATVFEYKVDGTYVPTASSAAVGTISVASIPTNNQWFFLDDGFGKSLYFEYKRDPLTFAATPGYYPIDVETAVFPVDVVANTVEAINKAGLNILAVRNVADVDLTNKTISLNGNQPIQIDPTLAPPWVVSGMSGGTDRIETVDISAATSDSVVAALTSAAINRTSLQVRAENPGIFNSFRVFSELKGTAGNNPITKGVATPLFLVLGLSGGTGGLKWYFSVKPDQDIILKVRFYPNAWLPTVSLPAGITSNVVAEIKSTDQDVERIDLLMRGDNAGGEIQMGSWIPSSQTVAALSNEYVAQMYGDYTVAATGIWAKPVMFSFEDVRAHLDRNNKLDEGWIRL